MEPTDTSQTPPGDTRILVVDDEDAIRDLLIQAVESAGYACEGAATGEAALRALSAEPADVVITDIKMPGMSGIELLREVKARHDADVIIITGYADEYEYESIIELGASDFVGKPFRIKEILVRLKRVLRERSLLAERNRNHEQLVAYSEDLNRSMTELQAAHEALHDSYLDTINRLAIAAEYRDEETGDHILRISRYSALIAEKIGLSPSVVDNIRYASPMHDVGKIGIPDRILLKPGPLTSEEMNIMKRHTTIGASILDNARAEILRYAQEIALSHHEWFNGAGYPGGLEGKAIPLTGRIVAVADVFDALTSARPYKNPYPADVAFDIIRRERGEHFDPRLADAFLSARREVRGIMREINPGQGVSLHDFTWSERERRDGTAVREKAGP